MPVAMAVRMLAIGAVEALPVAMVGRTLAATGAFELPAGVVGRGWLAVCAALCAGVVGRTLLGMEALPVAIVGRGWLAACDAACDAVCDAERGVSEYMSTRSDGKTSYVVAGAEAARRGRTGCLRRGRVSELPHACSFTQAVTCSAVRWLGVAVAVVMQEILRLEKEGARECNIKLYQYS